MSSDPHAAFEQSLLDLIEFSPTGAVPHTPTHRGALTHLQATHQVYPSADHKDGFVTARALARLPLFHAGNLDALIAGQCEFTDLEPDAHIYERYLQSLPAPLRARAAALQSRVVARPIHHRAKLGGATIHDPVHTLFLVPGCGPHPGLPGNYLYGSVLELGSATAQNAWAVQLHDADDGVMLFDVPSIEEALGKLQEILACAPFLMVELEALGFQAK